MFASATYCPVCMALSKQCSAPCETVCVCVPEHVSMTEKARPGSLWCLKQFQAHSPLVSPNICNNDIHPSIHPSTHSSMSGFGGRGMSFFPPTLFNPYLPSAENLLQILVLMISSFWSLPKRAVTKDWELDDIIWWIESFALRLSFPQQHWSKWHLKCSWCCAKPTLHPPTLHFPSFCEQSPQRQHESLTTACSIWCCMFKLVNMVKRDKWT